MSSSRAPEARRIWVAARAPVAIASLVLITAVLLAAVAGTAQRGLLDPDAVDPPGSRALARLLEDRGVGVERVRDAGRAGAAGPDATLLVAFPGVLSPSQLRTLDESTADLVLIAPQDDQLAVLAPQLTVVGAATVDRRRPRCALPAARGATADLGGVLYRSDRGQACYPAQSAVGEDAVRGFSLVRQQRQGRTVTVLGAADPLTNEHLDEAGNAALAMRLLGAHPRLVWYLPVPGALPPPEQRSLVQLAPPGWRWGAVQLGLGVLLLAAWRARRLGPVVTEPLPVVVRAAETAEGRARLYRRAGARDRAADTLRTGTRRRLLPMLGLPATSTADAFVDAVSARTGRAPGDVGATLLGPAPVDDAALVALREHLDILEREVRRS